MGGRISDGETRRFLGEALGDIGGELYRVAFIYLKNRDDALDAVQDAAYRCCKKIDTLKDRSLFRTWAVRTVINCCLDRLRKSGRTVSFDETGELSDPVSEEDAVVSRIALTDLIDRLDPPEKSMIILKHRYGMTFGEASEALKIPLGTAKSVYYRAVSKLKEGLE